MLSADRKVPSARLEKTVLLGELALDGRVRPVRGVLPAVLAAKREGWPAVGVPVGNLAETALVDGIEVSGVRTLRQVQAWLAGKGDLEPSVRVDVEDDGASMGVFGQEPLTRFCMPLQNPLRQTVCNHDTYQTGLQHIGFRASRCGGADATASTRARLTRPECRSWIRTLEPDHSSSR